MNIWGFRPSYFDHADRAFRKFLDENIAYARRLLASGVQTELVVYPGAFHAFDQSAGAAISRKFEADLLSALKRGLGI